jgi:hypothetical protein
MILDIVLILRIVSHLSDGESQNLHSGVRPVIQLISVEQLSRATARAKAGNLFVKPSSLFRQYHVTNRESGARYTVDFFVRKSDGKRFDSCTCKAGQNNIACKHLSAAAGYHVMRMAALREAERAGQRQRAA